MHIVNGTEMPVVFEYGTWLPTIAHGCNNTATYTIELTSGCGASPTASQTVTVTVTPGDCKPLDKQNCPFGGDGGAGTGAGGPVNVGSGDVSYVEPLFTVAQNPAPLSFNLTYHSEPPRYPRPTSSPVGTGWTHPFAQTLFGVGGGTTLLHHITAEGFDSIYETAGAGVWNAKEPVELRGQVTQVGGEYHLKDLNAAVTKFDVATGRWLSTVDRWGNTIDGVYTGADLTTLRDSMQRQIALTYSGGRISQITTPDARTWRFSYTVSRPSNVFDPPHSGATPWRTYVYQADSLGVVRLLTEVRDEASVLLEGHAYDGLDRGTTSVSEAGRDSVTIQYDFPAVNQRRVTHTVDGSTTSVSDFTLVYQGRRWLPTAITGICPSCGGPDGDAQVITYDASNHPTSHSSGAGAEGARTDFTHDANGIVLSRTEAVGKTEQRMTSFEYGKADWPSFATKITEPSAAKPGQNKITTHSWNVGETVLTTSVSGFLALADLTPAVYTTTTLFDSSHRPTEVSGPNAGQKTTSSYYGNVDAVVNRRGRLASSGVRTLVTPATFLTTTFDDYDIFGTARKVTDPNGVLTERAMDAKGRVTSVKSKKPAADAAEPPDYTTSYLYDLRDRLRDVVLPLGNKLHYDYENGTNRLTDTVRVDGSNNQRERLHLTLNTIGGKSLEEAQVCTSPANPCLLANWSTKRSESFQYDTHNRLSAVVHSDLTRVDYTYDSRGNLKDVKDERHTILGPNTLYEYDFLNRLKKVAQKRTIVSGSDVVTEYGYDVHDNLISVKDPNLNMTTYGYDDFGRMRKQTSPVSGVVPYSYDPAGNLLSSTDANIATTTRTYDVANRVLTATSVRSGKPTETVAWTYDDSVGTRYGKGRVATMSDPSGASSYAYERRGLLREESRTVELNAYTLRYGYDSNGNRSSIRYPSGRLVGYGYDFADRPASASSGSVSYVSSAAYHPFGPMTQLDYGNGTRKTMIYDLRYRATANKLVKLPTTTLADYTFGYDAVGNITSIPDAQNAAYSRSLLGYDDLNRLTTANTGASLWGSGSFAYDAMGNMTSLALGSARTATFSYSGTLPKLASVTETGLGTRAVSYDPAGNETAVGAGTFSYSSRNYLASGDGFSYTYEGRGLRAVTQLTAPVFPILLSVAPESVVGGSSATGTVTLNTGAPAGGAVVALASSEPAVASVPATVTVPVSQATQTFSVTTFATATDKKVVLSATYAGVTQSFVLTVTAAPRLVLVSLSPRTVKGGTGSTGTVSLNGNAPTGGATVTLSSSNPGVASVPTSVVVPQGQVLATFAATTTTVTASQAVTITATYGGVSRWASLTVVPFNVELSWPGRSRPLLLASLGLGLGRFFEEDEGRYRFGFMGLPLDGDAINDASGPSLFGGGLDSNEAGRADIHAKALFVPGPPKRHYLYSPELSLLAESEVASPRERTILYEYIWFGGMPVAQVDGTTTHWTFTDHLGTPLIQTDSAGVVYWRAEHEPYGRVFALRTADQHQPLRLPGQEAEQFNLGSNGATERSYNIFRWYRGTWGRYTQPDPIGLEDGINVYRYAEGNPLTWTDPRGLACSKDCPDCPRGLWLCGGFAGNAFGAFGVFGAGAQLLRCRCLANGFTCDFVTVSAKVGIGLSAGVTGSGCTIVNGYCVDQILGPSGGGDFFAGAGGGVSADVSFSTGGSVQVCGQVGLVAGVSLGGQISTTFKIGCRGQ